MSSSPLNGGIKKRVFPAPHELSTARASCCACCFPVILHSLCDLDPLPTVCRQVIDRLDGLSLTAVSDSLHTACLQSLWSCRDREKEKELPPLMSEVWKDIGFQSDPKSDWRGGGELSCLQLTYLAATYPAFVTLAWKVDFPFAAAAINVTRILQFHLGIMLESDNSCNVYRKVNGGKKEAALSLVVLREFSILLQDSRDEVPFNELYCYCCMAMYSKWLKSRGDPMALMNFHVCLISAWESVRDLLLSQLGTAMALKREVKLEVENILNRQSVNQ